MRAGATRTRQRGAVILEITGGIAEQAKKIVRGNVERFGQERKILHLTERNNTFERVNVENILR
jgi:hypothetical protein